MFDARASAGAGIDFTRDWVRRQRLMIATAGPRRDALTFLSNASWTSSGLIALGGGTRITREMYRRTARSGRVNRATLATLQGSGLVFLDGRRHPFYDEWPEPDYWQLLRVLADPCVFKPPAYWALLWTLLQAEQEFQTRWVDGWSHEERMTGQFLATISHSASEMAPVFSTLARASGISARLSLDYIDTARGRREKLTGADFGVILHGSDADGEWVKAALFQVKKAESLGRFDADFDQLQALLSSPGLGFYLLFTLNGPGAPPPVVNSANDFQFELDHRIEERAKEQHRPPSSSLGSQVVSADMMEDWAFFVALGLADPLSSSGVRTATPDDAARMLLRQVPVPPSRIIAFGLGEMAGRTNWQQVIARHDRDG